MVHLPSAPPITSSSAQPQELSVSSDALAAGLPTGICISLIKQVNLSHCSLQQSDSSLRVLIKLRFTQSSHLQYTRMLCGPFK